MLRNLDAAGRGRAIESAGPEGMPFLPHQGYVITNLLLGYLAATVDEASTWLLKIAPSSSI